jgi:DNA-binding NarL/FixJ family response regulator
MRRLLIIADHSFAAETMRIVLRYVDDVRVVGVRSASRPLDSNAFDLTPDTILIDDLESAEATLERLGEAAVRLPQATRVVLTSRMDDGWLERALDAGADAAIFKPLHPVALGMLLRETLRGNIVHRFRRRSSGERVFPLTSREIEILARVARGHTNGRIARELWVTEQTVKFHLRNTYRKLGVANRTEATRYAYMHALVPADEEELAC